MAVYILQHRLIHEILGVYTNKELAEKWNDVINYSIIIEAEIKEGE